MKFFHLDKSAIPQKEVRHMCEIGTNIEDYKLHPEVFFSPNKMLLIRGWGLTCVADIQERSGLALC